MGTHCNCAKGGQFCYFRGLTSAAPQRVLPLTYVDVAVSPCRPHPISVVHAKRAAQVHARARTLCRTVDAPIRPSLTAAAIEEWHENYRVGGARSVQVSKVLGVVLLGEAVTAGSVGGCCAVFTGAFFARAVRYVRLRRRSGNQAQRDRAVGTTLAPASAYPQTPMTAAALSPPWAAAGVDAASHSWAAVTIASPPPAAEYQELALLASQAAFGPSCTTA